MQMMQLHCTAPRASNSLVNNVCTQQYLHGICLSVISQPLPRAFRRAAKLHVNLCSASTSLYM